MHPSIFCTGYPAHCHRDLGVFPKELRAQVGGHFGWDANPLYANNDIHSHIIYNLEMLISVQCMSLDWRIKPVYLEETPKHGQNMHTRKEMNPKTRRSKANHANHQISDMKQLYRNMDVVS